MRTIYSIILISILTGCSDSNEPKTYTDLTGSWTFKGEFISGNFKIVELNNELAVDDVNGNFKINSNSFTIDTKWTVAYGSNAGTIQHIDLISDDDYIIFFDVTYSSDFKTITAESFEYGINPGNPGAIWGIVEETVIIKRK